MFNAFDAEPGNAVLAILLINGELYEDAREIISGDDFITYPQTEIWNAMERCYQNKIFIDINTTLEHIVYNAKGPGSVDINKAYLVNLANTYANPFTLIDCCKLVKKQSLARRGISFYKERISKLQAGEDPEEIISAGMLQDSALLENNQRHEIKLIGEGIIKFVDDLENKKRSGVSIIGLKTMFPMYDNYLGGLDPDTLHVIAARPGTFKTTFTLIIARNIAKAYGTVYFGSLEMSRDPQLQGKLLAHEAEMDSMAFRNLNLLKYEDIEALTLAAAKVSEYPLYVDDSTEIKASQIFNRMRLIKKQKGLKLGIIDYLQLTEPEKVLGNRRLEINQSIRIYKNMARDLMIPIILICQLNREVDKRNNPKPVFSDLNETGDIEQAASSITFLYRDPNDPEGIITGNIAKNRFGLANKTVKFIVDPKKSSYKQY